MAEFTSDMRHVSSMEIVIANVLGQPAATCQEASGIHVIPVTWTYVEAGLGKPLSDNYAEGWSVIALFLLFSKTGTMLPIRYIVMNLITKNLGIWALARGKVFIFEIHKGLTNDHLPFT